MLILGAVGSQPSPFFRASPEVQAMPEYVATRPHAERLLAVLRANPERSAAATAETRNFQTTVGIEPANGIYGPVTQQALGFYLPEGTAIPQPWQGTRPGTWSPPLWAREGPETIVDRPILSHKIPAWVWVLGAWLGVAGGTVIVAGIVDSGKLRFWKKAKASRKGRRR